MVKKSMKQILLGLAAFSAASVCAEELSNLSTSKNFFQPRAFSANLAREMLMEGSKHRDSNGWYGEFSAAAIYQRDWSQGIESAEGVDLEDTVSGLGTFPFWSGTNVMSYGTNSGAANLDSYQFGLGGSSTAGSIALNPVVYQAGADFMFVVGSSANEPCFFAKLRAPVGVYNINPNLTEVDGNSAVYPQGALALSTSTTANPATTMTQAFAGVQSGGQTAEGNFVPMQYGLINNDQSTGAKFGDIEMTAGYRFISNDDNSFSVAVRASAPTGNKAQGVYMLEPIFGRGGCWGLGGYLDGHVKIWEGNNDNFMMFKFMANAMHLFNADTVRAFDLVANGQGSRYLLVANYNNTAYQGTIQNLINVSTLACNSSFGVEGDGVVTFAYVGRGWQFDLGYEFWGRSSETLEITGELAPQVWTVLGRQAVGSSSAGTTPTYNCQPYATINTALAENNTAQTNVTASASNNVVADARVAANRISGVDALNVEAAEQATSLTSKVFSKVTFEWADSDYRPHLGVMGEFEISTCDNNALPQWGLSLIGGVSF
ncbi:MAG: hypothetical protein ACXWL5_01425 [Candidatus Chromulinivorax sp.]